MTKVFPTVIFGVGGTGCRTVDRLQKMLKNSEKYKHLDDKMFVFGALDTNQTDLIRLSLPSENRVPISENILSLKDYFVNIEARDGVTARDEVRSKMFEWFAPDSDIMFNHDLTKGAGQFRILSRAAWEAEMEVGGLSTRLDKVFEKVTHVDLNQYKIGNRIEVYIVSSIAGGTGSGASLMLARYARKYYDDRNIPCTIKGVLLMSDIFCHAPQGEKVWPRLRANGYAYLKEVEGLNKRQAHPQMSPLSFSYPEGNILPYDVAFLVDAIGQTGRLKYRGGDYSNFERFTAQALFTRLFCQSVSDKNMSAENNLINDLLSGEAEATTLSKRFCALGTSALVYPVDDTINLLSERVIADLVDEDWGRLDASFVRALDNYNKEIQMGNTNGKRPERYAHLISAILEEYHHKEEGEESSAFMVSIHQEVVSKSKNGDIDQAKQFIKAITNLMIQQVGGVSKSASGFKLLAGVDTLENAYSNGRTALGNLLRKQQKGLKEADSLIRNELSSIVHGLLEDVIFKQSTNDYSVFKYIEEKTLFGMRYFLSKVVDDLTMDAKKARKNFQAAELKMQELRDKKWNTSAGDAVSLEQYLAKDIPGQIGALSNTFNGKNKKIVTGFFEEFMTFYNDWVSERNNYATWWLKDRLYGELLKYLGEDSREGGLLALIYSVTEQLIKKTDSIKTDFERKADDSPIARDQFENMTLVYGNRDARNKQLKVVNEQLQSDFNFKRTLYQQLREKLVGKWYDLRKLEKEPSREYEYKRKKSALSRDTYEIVFSGLQGEAKNQVKYMNNIDLDVLTACEKEAEFLGAKNEDDILAYQKDILETLQKNSDVMIKLTARHNMQNLNYVVYNAGDDQVLEENLKTFASQLTKEPSTENDAAFGKHVLLFSRSMLCYNLRQIIGLTGSSSIAQNDYYSVMQSDAVSPHLDKRFNQVLEDFDTRFMEKMMLDMGFALISGFIDMRDDVFYSEENGIWESMEAVGFDELQHAFQGRYMADFKDRIDVWRSNLEKQDNRKVATEHELPALVRKYMSSEVEASSMTAASLSVLKKMRMALTKWLEGR